MTDFRAKSETLPVEVQVIEALRLEAQTMVSADGWYFDYDRADIYSEEFSEKAAAGSIGNVVIIHDMNEDLHDIQDVSCERWTLKFSIEAQVKETMGEERHRTEWRLVADLKKMFKNFLDTNNGTLIGPGRILHIEHECLGNGSAWALCEAEVVVSSTWGDATALL